MRVVVTGSRRWKDREKIFQRLSDLSPETTITHGGARGADLLVDSVARGMGHHVQVYLAEWKKFGISAGFLRNIKMLETKPDLVLAFWDGASPGTAHTIRQAKQRGIPVEIIR